MAMQKRTLWPAYLVSRYLLARLKGPKHCLFPPEAKLLSQSVGPPSDILPWPSPCSMWGTWNSVFWFVVHVRGRPHTSLLLVAAVTLPVKVHWTTPEAGMQISFSTEWKCLFCPSACIVWKVNREEYLPLFQKIQQNMFKVSHHKSYQT